MEKKMKVKSIFSAAVIAAAMVGSAFAQEKKNEYVSVDEVKAVAVVAADHLFGRGVTVGTA